jgi:DNA-binding GntR family transcriptional regulator
LSTYLRAICSRSLRGTPHDGPLFSEINHEFHRTIVASCGNDMLREMTMDIWQQHSGFQRVFRMDPDRPATSQREHEGIMAALRDHDAERAAKLALLHKRSVGESVSELVDEARDASADGGEQLIEQLAGRARRLP